METTAAPAKRWRFSVDAVLKRTLLFILTTAYVLMLFGLVVAVVVWPFGNPKEILGPPPNWLLPLVGHFTLLDAFLAILVGPTIGVNLLAIILALLTAPRVYRWLRIGVNDLIDGQHDDPFALMANIHPHLTTMTAPQALLPTVAATIAQTLKLPYVAIETVAIETQASDAPFESAFGRPPPGAAIEHLPLLYHDSQLGELRVSARRADEPLSQSDLKVLGDLARQVGITLYAAQMTIDLQHSRTRLVTAREEERRRIRRDLHDGLGPQLASQSLKLETAHDLIATQPERAQALLLDLLALSQKMVSEIRQLVYALRPPALDDFGLLGALQEVVARLAPPALQVTIQAADALTGLPAAVEVAAYRIAQEALTNVVKHAQATQVMIEISLVTQGQTLALLILTIGDNGQGMPVDLRAGVGMHSMRERVAELGGGLAIAPNQPQGTIVRVELPVQRTNGLSLDS